jgi:hypothetical protein
MFRRDKGKRLVKVLFLPTDLPLHHDGGRLLDAHKNLLP